MRKDWAQVQVSDVQLANKDRQSISVGESLQISARVHLGAVDPPQHVRVEAYHGEVDNGDLRNPTATVLNQSPTKSERATAITFTKATFPQPKAAPTALACASCPRIPV